MNNLNTQNISSKTITSKAIEVSDLVTKYGDKVIHNGINFKVERGKIVGLIGGSGSGKTTLLKVLLRLLRPYSGRVSILGQDVVSPNSVNLVDFEARYGVLFQKGALFSGLTVGQNISLPLLERKIITEDLVSEIVSMKLNLVGLESSDSDKMPSELSGGMIKRVSLARALALDPEILFLDEPTSGLDPLNARDFDELIRTLSRSLGITVFMISHDLDSIVSIVDQLIVLYEGKKIADGDLEKVLETDHPWIKEYFASKV